MPAYPVLERIAINIESVLNGVKRAAGYSIDLNAERRKRAGHNPADGLCVIWQGAASRDTETTGEPEGIIFRRVPFALQVYTIESAKPANPEPIDRKINMVVADIEKALMIDPQRDGNAHDTILGEAEPFDEGDNGYSGVLIPFDVQFGFFYIDPTTPI